MCISSKQTKMQFRPTQKNGENSRFGEMKRCWSSKYYSESITCIYQKKEEKK